MAFESFNNEGGLNASSSTNLTIPAQGGTAGNLSIIVYNFSGSAINVSSTQTITSVLRGTGRLEASTADFKLGKDETVILTMPRAANAGATAVRFTGESTHGLRGSGGVGHTTGAVPGLYFGLV